MRRAWLGWLAVGALALCPSVLAQGLPSAFGAGGALSAAPAAPGVLGAPSSLSVAGGGGSVMVGTAGASSGNTSVSPGRMSASPAGVPALGVNRAAPIQYGAFLNSDANASSYTVSAAGAAEWNGVYTDAGSDGVGEYYKLDATHLIVHYGMSFWLLAHDTSGLSSASYYSPIQNNSNPDAYPWSKTGNGTDPPPTVTVGGTTGGGGSTGAGTGPATAAQMDALIAYEYDSNTVAHDAAVTLHELCIALCMLMFVVVPFGFVSLVLTRKGLLLK